MQTELSRRGSRWLNSIHTSMRADLYLHHVRIFKSRSVAAQACTRGHVRIDGQPIKPARELKVGDQLDIQRGDLSLVIRVLDFPKSRMGAALVPQFMENLTPEENYRRAAEARREHALTAPHPFAAKPDKKQMRQIRQWLGMDESGG
jgi:ribosome-associated heat shock protein Hsp15